ncbi:MAG: hypothetical protein WBD28_06875 [Candidatus Zixiibacteriota bacterium]
MEYVEKLDKLLEDTEECARLLNELIQGAKDYDLERLLKKVDAQLIDARHNLVLACKKAKDRDGK